MQYKTEFGSLESYRKGTVELINGDVRHYVFSNIFEVAGKSRPYEKIVVGKNLEYVQEVLRADGTSPWFAVAHDEFAVLMDGVLSVEFVRLDDAAAPPAGTEGAVAINGEPRGRLMGTVKLGKGHQSLIPAGSAYRFVNAGKPGVILLQTMIGALSVQKWQEICLS